MLAGMIHWAPDPVIFRIPLGFAEVALRWYSLAFALAFIAAYFFMRRRFREARFDDERVDTLLIYMVVATLAGARLGHVLFYEPLEYLYQPWRILAIWEGGLASHGAALAILIALWLFTRRFPEMRFFWLVDRLVIPIALGGGLVRLGNLFNSEILGRPTDVPWAFVFARVDLLPRHPAQLYEAIAYFITAGVLYAIFRQEPLRERRGFLLGAFLVLVFTARFFIEFFKEPQVAFEQQMALGMGQLLSLPFVVAGVALMVRAKREPLEAGRAVGSGKRR
jgi:phosphatidylglycerol---prolipoprotein diacylglyceryl transferase